MDNSKKVIVLGGGAAGFFGAIACAQENSRCEVVILEKTRQLLTKVKISGGGRCNVTHACFDPAQLVKYYPRGGQALRGPFTCFQPKDVIAWFEAKGVKLKVESDGRMFPVTDRSETIIDCLMKQAKECGIEVRTECNIITIEKSDNGYNLVSSLGENIHADVLLISTGSASKIFELLHQLGHRIIPSVPSLFTFNVPDSPLLELAGVSVPDVMAKIEGTSLIQEGPILVTHWGFSGPAILKLSAWGARILYDLKYQATLSINWLPRMTQEEIRSCLEETKGSSPAKQMKNECPFPLPRQLWKKLIDLSGIPQELKWVAASKKHFNQLILHLQKSRFNIHGKSTYKDEFVTCGGVSLDEINFKTMESRICPGLYFAGEALDIDGVTGGFNFQNAWTTSWIAGKSIGMAIESLKP